jgi:NitT/TauT family transport system ATP-binding protein
VTELCMNYAMSVKQVQKIGSAAIRPFAAGDLGSVLVEFNDVALAYEPDGRGVVENISVQICAGEFVAIVGPSGCGKSTFMKLCSGLKVPTKGTVTVGGRRVERPLKNVGMAFQAPNLLPWRNALDNVMLPLEIVEPYRSNLKKHRDQHVAAARSLLSAVGLKDSESKFPWQLSGGMQQRVSICRSLIHKPELLLLDEPFGALDAFTREELWCVLRDLWTQQRFTAVLVTHDLREAAFLADTVYCMSARPGRIVTRRNIDLDRPRELELTYTESFNTIVYMLRERIGHARQQ